MGHYLFMVEFAILFTVFVLKDENDLNLIWLINWPDDGADKFYNVSLRFVYGYFIILLLNYVALFLLSNQFLNFLKCFKSLSYNDFISEDF